MHPNKFTEIFISTRPWNLAGIPFGLKEPDPASRIPGLGRWGIYLANLARQISLPNTKVFLFGNQLISCLRVQIGYIISLKYSLGVRCDILVGN